MGGIASGLGDIGSGVASLFGGGGDQAASAAAAGVTPPDTLFGVPMPRDTPPTPSPSFMQGFVQGFTGQPIGKGSDLPVGAGAQMAGGIGELMRAIQGLTDPMSTANPITGPIVNLVGQSLRGPEQAQNPFGYKPAGTPSNIIQGLLSSYTGGLLGSNKMGM